MPLIFVYGSLKRDKKLHFYLKEATFLDEVITCEKFTMILSKSKWYPYLLKDKRVKIKGELYKIDFKTLKKLDRLEEVPFYYKREKICVKGKKNYLGYVYIKRKSVKYLPHLAVKPLPLGIGI